MLAAETAFAPDSFMTSATWEQALASARQRGPAPDVIVTYANSAAGSDPAEEEALARVFPGVPTRNYKRHFGYTGKANNLLDLAAALADDGVAPGSVVLLDGQGFGFGVGYLTVKKLAPARGGSHREVRA